MSKASIGSLRAAAAIIFAAGPAIEAAAIIPAVAGAPSPNVPTVTAIETAAAATIAKIPIASTQKSGSFIIFTKSLPNCLNLDSASFANCSKALLASSPIFSNPLLILPPTSSNTFFMSSPNLRIAAAIPFFSGSKALAQVCGSPSCSTKSFNPFATSSNNLSKLTLPRICLPRIACPITSPP